MSDWQQPQGDTKDLSYRKTSAFEKATIHVCSHGVFLTNCLLYSEINQDIIRIITYQCDLRVLISKEFLLIHLCLITQLSTISTLANIVRLILFY